MGTPDHVLNFIMDFSPEPDWSDYENLLKFIKKGDKPSVVNLLSRGCRVVRPGTYNSPLHMAAERNGWAYIVKQFLECGARVASVNEENDTALHHAFLRDAADMSINSMVMSYLKETNENLVNNDGISYLHIASARSKLTYVKEFLKNSNVDVNTPVYIDSKSMYAGFTALHFAVAFGKADIVEYLVQHGASIYTRDYNGSTPLHLACYRRNVKIIDILLNNDPANINLADNLGTWHFMAACMSTEAIFVQKYIIVAHSRFNILPLTLVSLKMSDALAYPFPGYTPLHFAAQFGRLETVKILLNYGAFCCAMAKTGETPFTLAQINSHLEICDILKQHCIHYQTLMLANQVSPTAQNQCTQGTTVNFMNTPQPSIDNVSYQGYSSPDATSYNYMPSTIWE